MFKVFLFLLLVMSTGTSTIYILSQNIFKNTMLMQTELEAQSALNKLRRTVKYDGGVFYVPHGINGDDYHELPQDFLGVRTTSQGHPLVYCPYSYVSTPPGDVDVLMSNSSTYPVTVGTVGSGSVDYIKSSIASPVTEVLAFIAIPRSRNSAPACEDLGVDTDGSYVFTGDSAGQGRPFVLHRSDLVASGSSKTISLTPDSSMSLDQVFEQISEEPESDFVVSISPGDYELMRNHSFDRADVASAGSVYMYGTGPSVNVYSKRPMGADVDLTYDSMELKINNVNFYGSVYFQFIDSELDFTSYSATGISLISSGLKADSIHLGNATTTNPVFLLNNSEVISRGDFNVEGYGPLLVSSLQSSWTANNSMMRFDYGGDGIALQIEDSDISFSNSNMLSRIVGGSPSSWWYIDGPSEVSLSDFTLALSGAPTYGIYNRGKLNIKDTSLQTPLADVSLELTESSSLDSVRSSVGSSSRRAAIGINDNLSRSITGEIDIYAATCLSGGYFDLNFEINTVDDTAVTANPDGTIESVQVTRTAEVDLARFLAPIQIECL
jgi:hypothetical protein